MVEQAADSNKVVTAAVSLMKRLPPRMVAKTLAGLVNLVDSEEVRGDLMDKITSSLGKCPNFAFFALALHLSIVRVAF